MAFGFKKKTKQSGNESPAAEPSADDSVEADEIEHPDSTREIHGPSSDSQDIPTSTLDDAEAQGVGQVRAVIRIRPLTDIDFMRGNQYKIIQSSEDNKAVQVYMPDGRYTALTFDGVFDDNVSQASFFEMSGVRDLVSQALNGYAATIFAFGQTGSGKTFTITGPEGPQTAETVGIVPRALSFIFNRIASMRQAKELAAIRIQASYLEIYNEHVLDLLNPQNTALPVRWSAERGFYVENLFIVDCDVLDDSLAVLEEGLRNRTVAAHAMNEHSSRSHSVLTIYFEMQVMDSDERRLVKQHGKISFVDLAGSEKVKASKTSGETFTEALNINKSLLTLGQCISALSDPRKRQGHIPFRDSKLTKLLADSLGGHGLALMIACVSPGQMNIQETLKTLRYASKARRIQVKPMVMLDPKEEMVLILKREIQGLRRENMALRGMLEADPKYASTVAAMGTTPAISSSAAMVTAMDEVIGKSGKSRAPTASKRAAGGAITSSPAAIGMFPPLPHAADAMTSAYVSGNMKSTGMNYASPEMMGSGFASPVPTIPAFPPIHAAVPSSTGRRSAQASHRSPARHPAHAGSMEGGGSHDRRRSSSAHDAGPPTLATQRVSSLRRSAAPAGHDRPSLNDSMNENPAAATNAVRTSGSVGGSSRSPSRSANNPNTQSPTRRQPRQAASSPTRRDSVQRGVTSKKTNRLIAAEKTKSATDTGKKAFTTSTSLSKTNTEKSGPPKRPTKREHPPSTIKTSDEFASGISESGSIRSTQLPQLPASTSTNAGAQSTSSQRPPQQLRDNVVQIVNNRHQIMQDVHALNAEIGKMKSTKIR